MELSEVQRAVERLQAQGIPLEKITAPQVRELTGYGSYTSIIEHLRVLRGEAPADDASVDLVAEAEQCLHAAQQRVLALEAELPTVESRMEDSREAVLSTVQRQLAAKECRWRGYWPAEDESVLQAINAEVDAKTIAYREARRDLERMMKALIEAQQQLRAAEQGITEAKRQAFLQAHHPDLLAKLASLREEDPTHSFDVMHPRYFALQAQHRALVRQVETEIAEALQAAGV
jgi:hypothetical protein